MPRRKTDRPKVKRPKRPAAKPDGAAQLDKPRRVGTPATAKDAVERAGTDAETVPAGNWPQIDEHELRHLLDAVPARVTIIDRDGIVRYVNREAANFMATEPEALVGRRITELLGESYVRPLIKHARAALGGEQARWDGWVSFPSGERRYVEQTYLPYRDANGVIDGHYVLSRDTTKLKETEQEQQRAHRLLGDAIEAIPHGFVIFDADKRLILCNTAFAEVYDMTPEQMVGRTNAEVLDLFHAEIKSIDDRLVPDGGAFNRLMSMRWDDRDVTPYEVELKDGRWLLISICPTSEGGRVVLRTDITQLKRAESDVRDHVALMRSIIDASLDCIVTTDDTGRVIEFNPASERTFGYKREETMSRRIIDLVVPDEFKDQFRNTLGKALRDGDSRFFGRRFETVARRKDDSIFPVEISLAEAMRGDHRVVTGYVHDLTNRAKMESDLRKSEARFRSIAGAHPVPVAIGERKKGGRLLYVSDPWLELYRCAAEEAIGKSAAKFYVNAKDRERFLEFIERDGAVNEFEVEFRRGDGTTFWAFQTSRRIEFAGQDAIVSGVFDLTERRAAEEEIARQLEALHQSEKLSALGSLLAGVAHELNNPLSVVIGQSMMLADDAREPEDAKRAEKIKTAAERCGRIVRTFLDMARQREPARRQVDVNEVVDAALEIFGYGLPGSDVALERALADDIPVVLVDPDQLHQVVTNLCLNAQQAIEGTGRAGRIAVSTGRAGDAGVWIKVADDGPGISQEMRSRVFEPFFTSKSSGTGIGLSVSLGLIEAQGGRLEFNDADDGGTVFVIHLPVADEQGVETEAAAVSPPFDDLPRTALIVEDEPEIRDMLAEMLENAGYRTRTAENGKRAIDQLRQETFDFVISDLRMPELDGQSLYNWIESEQPATLKRLIFLTGDTLSASAARFLAGTGRPVIEKPIAPEILHEAIASLLATDRGKR